MLHPDLRAARFIPNFSWNLPLVRLIRRLPTPPTLVPAGLSITNRTVPGPDGAPDVRIRVHRPTDLAHPAPALLWLHGGGHLIGKPEQDDRSCLEFARRLRLTVLSVDYRLAPEHPFPAALDDAHAVLTWLAQPDGELAVDADRIAVGGASAG
ncbi:MAG: alpha/beta hydrolase, partial [Actinomycetota bacterium]